MAFPMFPFRGQGWNSVQFPVNPVLSQQRTTSKHTSKAKWNQKFSPYYPFSCYFPFLRKRSVPCAVPFWKVRQIKALRKELTMGFCTSWFFRTFWWAQLSISSTNPWERERILPKIKCDIAFIVVRRIASLLNIKSEILLLLLDWVIFLFLRCGKWRLSSWWLFFWKFLKVPHLN